MINEIIDGVCEMLKTNYPDITIYTEAVEQNAQVPAFFVYCTEETKIHRYLGKRWKAEIQIGVSYYSDSTEVNNEVNTMLNSLFPLSEYITADNILRRGTKQQLKNMDGFVYFTVNYDFFFLCFDENEFMQQLKTEVRSVKNGQFKT